MKNLCGILCFGTLFLFCGIVSAQKPGPGGPAPQKAVVSVASVTEQEDTESRRYTGLIVSKAVVQIVPRVSGEILEVGFQDGGFVKKGTVLYRLDPVQYEAAVKNAEAKIEECRARLEYAQNNYDRSFSLYEKNAESRDSMENTRSSLQTCKAALLAAEAELITAGDNRKNTTITAPIDGIAGVTNFTAGNYLTPSSGTLVTLIQVRPIRVRFSIATADYLSMFGSFEELKNNGSVKVRLSDGTWYGPEGKIELMNNEANRKTDAIQIYALFDNADLKLVTGGTVSVVLSKKKGRKLSAVPLSAVLYDSEGAYVYVADASNIPEKRRISPGNTTPEFQLVLSGLKSGERVVTKGTHKVVPGVEIEPSKEE